MTRHHTIIADRMRTRRTDLNMTLMAVAIATGSDPSQVSRWELGRVVPRSDVLPALARALKTSTSSLMGETALAEMDAT